MYMCVLAKSVYKKDDRTTLDYGNLYLLDFSDCLKDVFYKDLQDYFSDCRWK